MRNVLQKLSVLGLAASLLAGPALGWREVPLNDTTAPLGAPEFSFSENPDIPRNSQLHGEIHFGGAYGPGGRSWNRIGGLNREDYRAGYRNTYDRDFGIYGFNGPYARDADSPYRSCGDTFQNNRFGANYPCQRFR